MVPPPYRGFSFRTLFQYTGPSLMDGVEQENNITDDPQDEWSVYSDVEEAADALINGRPTVGLQFVRAGGNSYTVEVQAEEGVSLLQFLWMISFGRYTHCIDAPTAQSPSLILPVNPLAVIKGVTLAVIKNLLAERPRTLTEPSLGLEHVFYIPAEIWAAHASVLTVR